MSEPTSAAILTGKEMGSASTNNLEELLIMNYVVILLIVLLLCLALLVLKSVRGFSRRADLHTIEQGLPSETGRTVHQTTDSSNHRGDEPAHQNSLSSCLGRLSCTTYTSTGEEDTECLLHRKTVEQEQSSIPILGQNGHSFVLETCDNAGESSTLVVSNCHEFCPILGGLKTQQKGETATKHLESCGADEEPDSLGLYEAQESSLDPTANIESQHPVVDQFSPGIFTTSPKILEHSHSLGTAVACCYSISSNSHSQTVQSINSRNSTLELPPPPPDDQDDCERPPTSHRSCISQSAQQDASSGACMQALQKLPTPIHDELEQDGPVVSLSIDLAEDHDRHGSSGSDGKAVESTISDKTYRYLDSQHWVRMCMATNGQLEIMVKDIGIEEARKLLDENTNLDMNHVIVVEYISGHFRYLCDPFASNSLSHQVIFSREPGTDWMMSTVAGYLETSCGERQYAITSGHFSGKEANYCYASNGGYRSFGKCKHHFLEGELDIALVELNEDIPKQRMVNVLELAHRGSLKKYMPQIWKGNLTEEANKETKVLKHGPKGLIEGTLTTVLLKDDLISQTTTSKSSTDFKQYAAIRADKWLAGTCIAGDSGSLVTSMPDGKLFVHAYGVVCGLYVANGPGHHHRPLCIVSPLWPALRRVQESKQVEFRFVQPITQPTDDAQEQVVAAAECDTMTLGASHLAHRVSVPTQTTAPSSKISYSAASFADMEWVGNVSTPDVSSTAPKATSVCHDSDEGFGSQSDQHSLKVS